MLTCHFPDDLTSSHHTYYVHGFSKVIPTKTGEPYTTPTQHVGQYVWAGKKIAIDTADSPAISREVLDKSDLYFKTNLWPEYIEPRVLPLINGHGIHSEQEIDYLISLRNTPKEFDLSLVCRIWGGELHLERTLRLFEHVSRLQCKSFLVAILSGLSDQAARTAIDRLTKINVPFLTRPTPRDALMKLISRSRWTIVRMGKRLAVPWRMTECLAMGSSIMVDTVPKPIWYQPLDDTVIPLGIPCEPIDYDACAVDQRLEIVFDDVLCRRMQASSCMYFDSYAHPVKVAEYVLNIAKQIPF